MSSGPSTSSSNESLSNEEDLFTLYTWPWEWELASLDPECLTALCFLKFTNLNHKVVYVDSSLELLKNDYPKLLFRNETYTGLDNILECIKKKKNINRELNDENYANMLAQLNYFKEKFLPAFKILCWLDEENTYTVIRRAYGSNMRFPFSLIKLRTMTHSIQNSIMCNYRGTHLKYENLKSQILNDAKECLNQISNLLGFNIYMFENRPTLIDAYLFGYLSILKNAPFVNSPLKSQLTMCSNLGSLISRTQKDVFSIETEKFEKLKKIERERIQNSYWYSFASFFSSNNNNKKTLQEQNEEWELNKQRMLAVTIGVVAMATFALKTGIIKFNLIKTDLKLVEEDSD